MVKSIRTRVRVKTTGPAEVTVDVTTKTVRKKPALHFAQGNGKLGKETFIFSLPAGWTCPGARDCLSRADRNTGKLKDGKHTIFRCFAASAENYRHQVRNARWRNFRALKRARTTERMAALILEALPEGARFVRIHDSGDFWSQEYTDAWLAVARARPQTVFYAYTKGLPFVVARLGSIPDNLVLTASWGGKYDHLIREHGLRSARVVYSVAEADALGLAIDHDDSLARAQDGQDFALLIHGMQPRGSDAMKAVQALRVEGEFGYGERADRIRQERGRTPLRVI